VTGQTSRHIEEELQMHPYLSQALAQAQMTDAHRRAASARLAATAAQGRKASVRSKASHGAHSTHAARRFLMWGA
jgi:hypothetical protein